MSDVFELTKALINRQSVTPDDGGCQQLLAERLESVGFSIRHMPFGEVTNLYASHKSGHSDGEGEASPSLLFAGHTDVVPEGPREQWHTDPFHATLVNNELFGRGAADMKSSLSAMVIAAASFVRKHPDHKGTIALLITSDEEAVARDGTRAVVARLQSEGQQWDYCIVGEPTASDQLGDTIKNGRRGSLNAKLTILGTQGHIAYPHLALNAVHMLALAVGQLCAIEWDQGDEDFPATSLQFSNVQAGTGANNVIPGTATAEFNLRFNPAQTEESIVERVENVLNENGIKFAIEWTLSGNPFITRAGYLTNVVSQSIKEELGVQASLSTTGGTSDGRFIAPTGTQVVELGPINKSIHKVNEHISVADLERLPGIYESIINKILLEDV